MFKEPKTRYVGDLTNIPNELRTKTKYIYQFIIIAHFSKFLNSYLLENKKSNSILKCLNNFFIYFGKPKEYGSDNGKEFLNSAIQNFLKDNDVKFIRGRPYQPHSQGVVERVHITLRKALVSKFLEDIEAFDIEESLPLIVNIYNNTIHSVTQHTPFEIFYSKDSNFHKKYIKIY